MKGEKKIVELFQQTTDYCSEQFEKLPVHRRDPFLNEFGIDPELTRLMTLAEAEGDPEKVRVLLRSYCKRFREFVRAYDDDKP